MNISHPHRYTAPLSQAIESAITRMYWNEVYTGDAPCPAHHYGIEDADCICINKTVSVERRAAA